MRAHRGGGGERVRLRLLEALLGREAFAAERLVALGVGLGAGGLGAVARERRLLLGQHRAVQPRVEREQRLAAAHHLAFDHVDLLDLPVNARSDGHHELGGDHAIGQHLDRQRAEPHRLGLDRHRRVAAALRRRGCAAGASRGSQEKKNISSDNGRGMGIRLSSLTRCIWNLPSLAARYGYA